MTAIPELTVSEIERFRSKLRIGGCGVQWNGPVNNNGYGRFEIYRNGRRSRVLAHRLAYKLATGVDPGASVIRHACDIPGCCTPDCFLLGTQADNIHDAVERDRMNTDGLKAYSDARDDRARQRVLEGVKRCSRCKSAKALAKFYCDARSLDGHTYWCKECCAEHRALAKGTGDSARGAA